jgi:hypothetical protein
MVAKTGRTQTITVAGNFYSARYEYNDPSGMGIGETRELIVTKEGEAAQVTHNIAAVQIFGETESSSFITDDGMMQFEVNKEGFVKEIRWNLAMLEITNEISSVFDEMRHQTAAEFYGLTNPYAQQELDQRAVKAKENEAIRIANPDWGVFS